jgi:hypothetical protein
MSAFDAVVLNDQNDGSGCQRLRARSARFQIPSSTWVQRLRRKAEFSKIVSTLTERDLPASMPAWSRTLFGSPVVGNAHGSCDRERRCAEQIRIAIVLIGNGIAQPMRSPLGN